MYPLGIFSALCSFSKFLNTGFSSRLLTTRSLVTTDFPWDALCNCEGHQLGPGLSPSGQDITYPALRFPSSSLLTHCEGRRAAGARSRHPRRGPTQSPWLLHLAWPDPGHLGHLQRPRTAHFVSFPTSNPMPCFTIQWAYQSHQIHRTNELENVASW